jgi:uncharacterized membrane protein
MMGSFPVLFGSFPRGLCCAVFVLVLCCWCAMSVDGRLSGDWSAE